MTLAGGLGLSERELVSVVGAGGKSTLLLQLADELTKNGSSVALTTTTKMGTDQIPPEATVVRESAESTGDALTFLVGEIDEPKVMGVEPEVVDSLFSTGKHDYVLVEADGARRKSIKAPNDHEPVIPSLTTTVIVVAGLHAIGGRIIDVAHRPENVASILGREVTDVVRPLDIVRLVLSPVGGFARVPPQARVAAVLTYATPNSKLDEVCGALRDNRRIRRVMSLQLNA